MIELSELFAANHKRKPSGLAGLEEALKRGSSACLHNHPGQIYEIKNELSGWDTSSMLGLCYSPPAASIVVGNEFLAIYATDGCLNENSDYCIDTIYVKENGEQVAIWTRKWGLMA